MDTILLTSFVGIVSLCCFPAIELNKLLSSPAKLFLEQTAADSNLSTINISDSKLHYVY